ncbi:MAG: NADPH:quinone reductase [Micrococcales bacterium]|nr:NADPH:quinone reductase [Micrococcales bacterium]
MGPQHVLMHAAYITARGLAETIRFGELPAPGCGPGEVLVRVEAVSVNHVDTFVRSGAYPTRLPFPFVIGRDVVGVIVAVGSGVTAFARGDRVWSNSLGHDGRQGPSADFAVVPADRAYPLPEGVAAATAVAIVHPAATAYLALHAHGGIRGGETVHIGGGAGQVGSALVTLAAESGARVICSASAADRAYCRSMGADDVLDYRADDLAGRLRAIAPGGIDLAIDTSAREDVASLLDLLAPRGRVVVLAGMTTRVTLTLGELYTHDRSIRGFAISNATVAELTAAAGTINRLLARGALTPRRIETLPMSHARRAHARLEDGDVRGTRIVLVPDEAMPPP